MSKKIIECKYCKKKLEVYNSSTKKFCSRQCYFEYKKKQTKYLNFVCHQCKKEYILAERFVKAELKKNPNKEFKFCSPECASKYHGRNRIEVECPVCHKKFLQQKKVIAHQENMLSRVC